MNLVAYTATALSRNDITDTPTNKNIVDGAIVELKDLDGNLVVIYDDESGSNPETQKSCNTNGQLTFWAEVGDYILIINGEVNFITIGASVKFTKQSRQAIEAVYKAQGYNNVFFFEDGFTYTESNDVGIYEDGTAWTYADAGALPVTVAAGTVPSEGVYRNTRKYPLSTQYTSIEGIYENFGSDYFNVIHLGSFHDGLGYGGQSLVWAPDEPKSNHGITGFSPTVPSPSNQLGTGLDDKVINFLKGEGETDESGFGLWSFVKVASRDIAESGGVSDNSFDSGKLIRFLNDISQCEDVSVSDRTFYIKSDTDVMTELTFNYGALDVESGYTLRIVGDVNAPERQVFYTHNDFDTDPREPTDIKLVRHKVKPEWFGAKKVDSIDDVKTIPDQTSVMFKAIRAAIGNYVDEGRWVSENPKSLLKLGTGYYRVDKDLSFGFRYEGETYFLNGSGIVGDGYNASYLIRTDLTNTDRVCSIRYHTRELTIARDFKVNAYDPDESGEDRFLSASAAMLWLQGDSIFVNRVWASGAQVTVTDSNGVERNGVGIQTESSTDTFLDNVFVENCATNYAFSSATVKLSNATSFESKVNNIGIGNFSAEWPDEQTTGNTISISGLDSRSVNGSGITVLSKGDNTLFVNGANMSGIRTNVGTTVGKDIVTLLDGAKLSGSIKSLKSSSMAGSLLYCYANSIAGTLSSHLLFEDIHCTNMNNLNPTVRGVLTTKECLDANVYVNYLSLDVCRPVLTVSNHKMDIKNVTLSGFVGASDSTSSRQLFVQTGGDLVIDSVTRSQDDTVALTAYGWQAASTSADINISTLSNATRAIGGTGNALMISKVAFA